MDVIKHHGIFRGAATVPLATFFIRDDAEDYARHQSRVTIKECYMLCGCLCPSCGNLVTYEKEPLDD